MPYGDAIDTFEIDEALAKELSDLLAKQGIRERVLAQVVDQPEKYDAAEKLLIPVVQRIEAIKHEITQNWIPDQYRSARYVWNYNGWEIDRNKVQIFGSVPVITI